MDDRRRSSTPSSSSSVSSDLERVFNKFNSNGNDKILSEELAEVLTSLYHPSSEEELCRMMVEADSDGDDFISLEEFVKERKKACRNATFLQTAERKLEEMKRFLLCKHFLAKSIVVAEMQRFFKLQKESLQKESLACRKTMFLQTAF
ncbi:hypothetical protein ZIOFF_001332 [Zingiber officinale]|uniref:EF-hand domain-containing protein n=1 Tax=Zingiber officinale TaxID=94328 RepID=A0A8J5LYD7_ZINOF|nr:hypothetical protein ZIOFF_001332 [Zingiber officinale]